MSEVEVTRTFRKQSSQRATGRKVMWSLVCPMYWGGQLGKSQKEDEHDAMNGGIISEREYENDEDVTINKGI